MAQALAQMAGVTGLEPAASGVTGRRSNQLSYTPRVCNRNLGHKGAATLRKERGCNRPEPGVQEGRNWPVLGSKWGGRRVLIGGFELLFFAPHQDQDES